MSLSASRQMPRHMCSASGLGSPTRAIQALGIREGPLFAAVRFAERLCFGASKVNREVTAVFD
jgi:hypothetical protein